MGVASATPTVSRERLKPETQGLHAHGVLDDVGPLGELFAAGGDPTLGADANLGDAVVVGHAVAGIGTTGAARQVRGDLARHVRDHGDLGLGLGVVELERGLGAFGILVFFLEGFDLGLQVFAVEVDGGGQHGVVERDVAMLDLDRDAVVLVEALQVRALDGVDVFAGESGFFREKGSGGSDERGISLLFNFVLRHGSLLLR